MPQDRKDMNVSATDGPDGEDGRGASVDAGGAPDVQAVPAPGHADSSAGPGVRKAQGASPEDGITAGDKAPGSDASVSSPGAWTALAAPGAPDGEVDTRS